MIDSSHGPAGEATSASTSFCQQCGRPLNGSTARVVGAAVYCEPCLAARIAASPGPVAANGAGPAGPQSVSPRSMPNPGVATLLGFIPGVGAMYNEQYAKGVVHLMIFAMLVVLSDNVNGIFGIFIAGWVFYMAIEAHHTARARRDHTVLPNPFGLNNIGERWGFGKAWPAAGSHGMPVFSEAANAATEAGQPFGTHWQAYVAAAPWAPANPLTTPTSTNEPLKDTFGDWSPVASDGAGAQAAAPPDHLYAQNSAAGTQEPWRDTFHSAQVPGGYDVTSAPLAPLPDTASRFPAGAVWLIGAGIFFLFATTGVFSFLHKGIVVGLGLLALAVWMFARCMLQTGNAYRSDGSPAYTLRTLRASRGAAWVGLTGLLSLASTLHILGWNRSWPLYIILGGVLGFAERAIQPAVAVYPPLPPRL